VRTSATLGPTTVARSPSDVSTSGTLAPPVGTRDLLPPEAADRRALTRALAETLELHGYALVTTPPFELVETLERGLGGDPRETLRFVDPETGEVSVFRPDLTVQVARLVASGLRDRPPPLRLYYDGHVVRARRGRARRQRQIAQIGAECLGVPGALGDAEVIALASRTLSRVGLAHRVEIAIVPMVRALCNRLPEALRPAVTSALARKDRLGVERALGTIECDPTVRRALLEVGSLTGGLEVLARARPLLEPVARTHLVALEALCEALDRRGLASQVRLDLGEVRGFEYYTGPSFALLADGPGEPLGGGGRYDDLLGRFGAPMPASGFAVDLDHLTRAMELQARTVRANTRSRVCVVGASDAELEALRARGIAAASLEGASFESATAYAEAWQLGAAVALADDTATIQWIGASREQCARADVVHRLARAERASAEDQT